MTALLVVGHCANCRPAKWAGDARDHQCAADDEYDRYGTVLYTVPTQGGRSERRTWPVCEECGFGYCSLCGAEKWYQTL